MGQSRFGQPVCKMLRNVYMFIFLNYFSSACPILAHYKVALIIDFIKISNRTKPYSINMSDYHMLVKMNWKTIWLARLGKYKGAGQGGVLSKVWGPLV